MWIVDKLLAKSLKTTHGKLRYRNRNGDPVTITKGIHYTVNAGTSHVHIHTFEDVLEHCEHCGYVPGGGKGGKIPSGK